MKNMERNDRIGRFGWILVLFLGLNPSITSADEASELYQSGVELFKAEKFLEASTAFRKAYALRPSWKVYYNIGQCEAAAKRYGIAIEAFESYLVGGGDEIKLERTEYVVGEIRRLQTLVGRLELVAPPGIEVYLDGDKRGTTPLEGPLRVAAGKHHVALKKGEETILEKRVQIAGGIATKVTAPSEQAEPEPAAEPSPEESANVPESEPPEPTPEPPEPVVEKGHSWMWPAGLAALGTGAATLIAGTVTGSLALAKSNKLADQCKDKIGCSDSDKELKESSDSLAIATNVLLPVGGALAVGGALLVFFEIRRSKERESALRVHPTGGPDLMGVIMSGRF